MEYHGLSTYKYGGALVTLNLALLHSRLRHLDAIFINVFKEKLVDNSFWILEVPFTLFHDCFVFNVHYHHKICP
jgi:hypothetical protein